MGSSVSVNKISKKNLWIVGTIILCIITIILVTIGNWIFNGSRIFPNIFIESVDVGGLTPEEAKVKVKRIFEKEIDSFRKELVYKDSSWQLSYEDLGLYYLFDDYIDKAYGVGRSGNYYERIKKINNLRKNPEIIRLEPYYNPSEIENVIKNISQTVNKPSIDAEINRKNGTFIIKKEVLGVEVDENALRESIVGAIGNFNNDTIHIPVKNTTPEIIEEDLSTIQDLIGEYVTTFNSQEKGRSENIKLAVNSINNMLLMPGDEFSFNESTGPRSAEEGYKEAPVIVNGELVPGIGGGICQVSTTLYQATLRSDVEVTSRRNHGRPVGYVPIGQDATVAYGYIDFKFRNNKDYPIYIESYINGEQVHVKLYSKKTNNMSIDLESEIIEVVKPEMEVKKDPNMDVGERRINKAGKKGYRVVTYKVYLQDGKELKKEVISKDYYPPRDGIVIEGIKQ